MQGPIVITGLRKSGTSMFKNLLDGHPELFVFPSNELHVLAYTEANQLLAPSARARFRCVDGEVSFDAIKEAIAGDKFLVRLNDDKAVDFTD